MWRAARERGDPPFPLWIAEVGEVGLVRAMEGPEAHMDDSDRCGARSRLRVPRNPVESVRHHLLPFVSRPAHERFSSTLLLPVRRSAAVSKALSASSMANSWVRM